MGLMRMQYAELKKGHLRHCCIRDWTNIGWRIRWNVTATCETFKTGCDGKNTVRKAIWRTISYVELFSTCQHTSVASSSTTWVPSNGRVNSGYQRTWTHLLPRWKFHCRRFVTSQRTLVKQESACDLDGRGWPSVTWREGNARWLWPGGMSFKQLFPVSQHENWFHR